VARWSFAALPKFLPADSVKKVLDGSERNTAVGRRNYAILLLLARLGLRACEVVALNLEDIDWENARITIRAKGGRWNQLPLPTDVGEALALYLRHARPSCSCREFLSATGLHDEDLPAHKQSAVWFDVQSRVREWSPPARVLTYSAIVSQPA